MADHRPSDSPPGRCKAEQHGEQQRRVHRLPGRPVVRAGVRDPVPGGRCSSTPFLDGAAAARQQRCSRSTPRRSPPRRAGARAAILGSIWVIASPRCMAIPLGHRRGGLPGGVRRPEALVQPAGRGQPAEPRRGAGHRLRHAHRRPRAGDRPPPRHRPRRRHRAGPADPAGHHHHHPRGAARRARRRSGRARSRSGATPLQTVWRQTLPAAVPGIATGTILALSRALGEAAPLLLLGGLVFVTLRPRRADVAASRRCRSRSSTGPATRRRSSSELAAAAIIVLLVLLLAMNAVAIIIRNRYQKRW